jgi:hypothetical protein
MLWAPSRIAFFTASGFLDTPSETYDSFASSKWLIVQEKSDQEMPPRAALQPHHQRVVLHTGQNVDDLSGNLCDANASVPAAVHEPTGLRGAEWMAIKPLLSRALIGDPSAAMEAAHRIAERLNKHSGHESLWRGEVMPGAGLIFSRSRQGMDERYLIDSALLLDM